MPVGDNKYFSSTKSMKRKEEEREGGEGAFFHNFNVKAAEIVIETQFHCSVKSRV